MYDVRIYTKDSAVSDSYKCIEEPRQVYSFIILQTVEGKVYVAKDSITRMVVSGDRPKRANTRHGMAGSW